MMTIYKKLKIYGPKKFLQFAMNELYLKVWMQGVKKSYSQSGEDLEIHKLTKKKRGFYIDIGAYDPERYSNTKKFYDMGWRGINIEPDVVNFKKFREKRKRDINLNIGISNQKGVLPFYEFVPDTLSTFSKEEARKYQKQGYKLVGEKNLSVEKLAVVIKRYCSDKKIDFISVDTEGHDLEVLEGNDWKRYRPKIVCIETLHHNKDAKRRTTNKKLENFLVGVNYKKVFDNNLNAIFIDNTSNSS